MAVDHAMNELAVSYTKRKLIGSKEEAVSAFFLSLYNSLDLMDDPIAQQKLRLYVPAIILTDYDGIYVFFNEERMVSGITNVAMRWSERYPYVYEDDCFIYNFTMDDTVRIFDKNQILSSDDEDESVYEMDYHEFQTSDELAGFRASYPEHFLLQEERYYLVRKQAIIQTINEKTVYYVNQHNAIAPQYGITYNFSVPIIDESELLRSVEHPGLIAFFQGYPLQRMGQIYNRAAIGGAQIYKKDVYYLEEKGWYKIYHTSSCPQCETNGRINQETIYYSVKDCVEEGAYACEECCPQGVHVPNYRK